MRHATCALTDSVLLGRTIDASLDEHGQTQARALGDYFRNHPGLRVQSSPRERARQTAAAIAESAGATVTVAPDLDEVDFGEWSGCSFAELARDPYWRWWNERRGAACTPAGDHMQRIRTRVMNHLRRLHRQHPGAQIALVTHAENIRAVVLHCMALSDDAFAKIDIAPATITALRVNDARIAVNYVNRTTHEQALRAAT